MTQIPTLDHMPGDSPYQAHDHYTALNNMVLEFKTLSVSVQEKLNAYQEISKSSKDQIQALKEHTSDLLEQISLNFQRQHDENLRAHDRLAESVEKLIMATHNRFDTEINDIKAKRKAVDDEIFKRIRDLETSVSEHKTSHFQSGDDKWKKATWILTTAIITGVLTWGTVTLPGWIAQQLNQPAITDRQRVIGDKK